MRHAQHRAKCMQRLQATSLMECASEVQNSEQTYQKQREEKESLRNSRSSNFAQRPAYDTSRNERLELLEKLERGPISFEPPANDPHFDRFEPNSQTKLKYVKFTDFRARNLSHVQLQHHLDCRYALSPSTLYSLTGRLGSSIEYTHTTSASSMDGDYEVPLYGDWVLFAVMGEKSEMKYTASAQDTDASVDPARATRKYFGCQLLDLSTKYVETSRELPGHCLMRMLVFDNGVDTNHAKSDRSAFEKLWKERDGMLLAILNPKIMQPRKGVCGSNLL